MLSETYYDLWFNNEISVSEVFIRIVTLISFLEPIFEIHTIYIPLINSHGYLEKLPEWLENIFKKIKGNLYYSEQTLNKYNIDDIIPKKNIKFYNTVISALSASNIPVLKEQQLPEYGFIP